MEDFIVKEQFQDITRNTEEPKEKAFFVKRILHFIRVFARIKIGCGVKK